MAIDRRVIHTVLTAQINFNYTKRILVSRYDLSNSTDKNIENMKRMNSRRDIVKRGQDSVKKRVLFT